MAVKRSAEDADIQAIRPRRQNAKRTRLSPFANAKSDSSASSTASVSEDSALQSSAPASEHTRQSSVSSVHTTGSDDGSESSLSSSSEESEESGSDEEITTVGGPKKPDMARSSIMDGSNDLRSRLAALLPQLAESNKKLQGSDGAQNIEDVEEGKQHIELDLGLGVLEETNRNHDESNNTDDSSEGEDEEHAEDEEEDIPASSGSIKQSPESKRTNVMGKLMGQPRNQHNAGIKEVG